MSTRPAKSPSLSSTAAACVASLDPDDAEVSELLSLLHPTTVRTRARRVASSRCFERLLLVREVNDVSPRCKVILLSSLF
jgi:hypothetical protein